MLWQNYFRIGDHTPGTQEEFVQQRPFPSRLLSGRPNCEKWSEAATGLPFRQSLCKGVGGIEGKGFLEQVLLAILVSLI